MDFIKNSFRELRHVVWPTAEETKKYFISVVVILILFGLYLFVTGAIFEQLLFTAKDLINIK